MTYDPTGVAGPPCGCHTIGACVHRDPTIRLVEHLDMSCPVGAALCGSLGVAEREAAGRRRMCCAQLLGVAS
jgi:hypothetical protein